MKPAKREYHFVRSVQVSDPFHFARSPEVWVMCPDCLTEMSARFVPAHEQWHRLVSKADDQGDQ